MLIIFVCFSGHGLRFASMAQDPVFSQQMFHQLYFNPSFAGNIPYPRICSGYRNQWAGIGSSYVSYYASYDQYVSKMAGGLGIGMVRDLQGGSFSRTAIDFAYSYHIKFYDAVFSQGVQSSIVQQSVNVSSFSLPDDNPYETQSSQEAISNKSVVFPDFSFGTSLAIGKQYECSFSVHHLNFMNRSSNNTSYSNLPINFGVQFLGRFEHSDNNRDEEHLVSMPGISASFQEGLGTFQWGTNLKYSDLIGGFWIRNTSRLEFNTFIIFVGYQFGGLSFGYTYDIWRPKYSVGGLFLGSHEVTLMHLFQYNDPKKKMKTVPCPKFYF